MAVNSLPRIVPLSRKTLHRQTRTSPSLSQGPASDLRNYKQEKHTFFYVIVATSLKKFLSNFSEITSFLFSSSFLPFLLLSPPVHPPPPPLSIGVADIAMAGGLAPPPVPPFLSLHPSPLPHSLFPLCVGPDLEPAAATPLSSSSLSPVNSLRCLLFGSELPSTSSIR